MTDEEAAALQEKVAKQEADLVALKSAHAEGTQKYQNLEQAYQRDIGTLTAYAQNILNSGGGNRQNQPPPEDPTDPAVIEKRKWKEEVMQSVNEGINPVVSEYYRNQRSLNRTLTTRDEKLAPIYTKYKDEIEKILDAQPPQVQAHPDSYVAACKAVAALHLDEIVTERTAAAEAARVAALAGDGEEDVGSPSGLTPPSSRVPSPSPSPSGARGPDTTSRRTRKVEPLSREEQHFAGVFGLEADDYDTYSHDLTRDVLGFKDPKTGKVRARV